MSGTCPGPVWLQVAPVLDKLLGSHTHETEDGVTALARDCSLAIASLGPTERTSYPSWSLLTPLKVGVRVSAGLSCVSHTPRPQPVSLVPVESQSCYQRDCPRSLGGFSGWLPAPGRLRLRSLGTKAGKGDE